MTTKSTGFLRSFSVDCLTGLIDRERLDAEDDEGKDGGFEKALRLLTMAMLKNDASLVLLYAQ